MILDAKDKTHFLQIRGEFGYSNGFGAIKFAFNRFGLRTDLAGIYQKKKTLKGWRLSKAQFYRTSNPRTVPQQANRSKFAAGLPLYRALSDLEKKRLTALGRRYKMTGFNLFMRYYMRS